MKYLTLALLFVCLGLSSSGQTWGTWDGKTVGSSTGNAGSLDGKTTGTSTGNYYKWNNLTLLSGAFGAQDVFTHFTTGSGNITATNIATGTAGTSNCSWARNGTAASLNVGASQTSLPYSVGPVASTTYPAGTTTQSIAIDDGDNTSLPTIICTLQGSPGGIGTWSGYVTLNMKPTVNTNYLFDRVVISGSGSTGYAALQIQVGQQCLADGGYGVNLESVNPSFTTIHTPCIPIAPGGKYWITMQFNETTGIHHLSVYNPVNFALIGSVTSALGPTGGTLFSYRLGQNEGGLSSGTTSYIEDSMFNFTTHPLSPTPVTPPLAPTYVGQGSSTGSATAGTTIAATRTPASTSNGLIAVACTTATTGTITMADTQGNTYTSISGPTNVGLVRCSAFTKFGLASTASDTITATFGTSGADRFLDIVECANCSSVDQNTGFVGKTTAAGGLFSSTAVTPTQQPELGVGFGTSTTGTITGTGWAPVAMEAIGFTIMNAAQINSTASVAANFVDGGFTSGTAGNAFFVTIK